MLVGIFVHVHLGGGLEKSIRRNDKEHEERGEGLLLYIHTSLGSVAVGAKAIPSADPKAF